MSGAIHYALSGGVKRKTPNGDDVLYVPVCQCLPKIRWTCTYGVDVIDHLMCHLH